MKILLIDNNDSFTMNLAQIFEELKAKIDIISYDLLQISEVESYTRIVFSPGPGLVWEYEKLFELLKNYGKYKNILGICLGHQVIGVNYGAKLIKVKNVEHGKKSRNLIIQEDDIFKNIPNEFEVGRYHSWALSEEEFPEELEIICKSDDNIIMGIKHKEYNIIGLQFHPESIITQYGKEILCNWMHL